MMLEIETGKILSFPKNHAFVSFTLTDGKWYTVKDMNASFLTAIVHLPLYGQQFPITTRFCDGNMTANHYI
jgi:hypothetical protein